ncbi:hypothetical protein HDU98_010362 [Podochytrium sp. JEL0797]|nr:hypothetical protein HDU98_010362 [Podochytrium sp. JEL0797]
MNPQPLLNAGDAETLLGAVITLSKSNLTLPSQLVLTKFIQSGSYAHVFEAIPYPDSFSFSSDYAVKVVQKKGLTARELRQQRIEADLLAKLTQQVPAVNSIVPLHAVAETDSHLFLVMDKFDNDLLGVINSGALCAAGPFYDMEDALEMSSALKVVFGQIVDSVESCHNNGIFHQDIKPENILIRNADFNEASPIIACLSDFGLATKNPYPTTFGAGSVSYTSPESLAGLDPSARQPFYSSQLHDMWGLSVVLFVMITGRTPWYSATTTDAVYVEYQEWVKMRKQHRINHGSTRLCPPSNLRLKFGLTEEVEDLFERLFDGANAARRLKTHEIRDWVNSCAVFITPDMLFGQPTRTTVGMMEDGLVPNDAPWPKMTDLFSMPRSWSSDCSEMDFSAVPTFSKSDVEVSDDAEDSSSSEQFFLEAVTTTPTATTRPATLATPSSKSVLSRSDSFSRALGQLFVSSSSSSTESYRRAATGTSRRGSRKWNASQKSQLSKKLRPPTTSSSSTSSTSLTSSVAAAMPSSTPFNSKFRNAHHNNNNDNPFSSSLPPDSVNSARRPSTPSTPSMSIPRYDNNKLKVPPHHYQPHHHQQQQPKNSPFFNNIGFSPSPSSKFSNSHSNNHNNSHNNNHNNSSFGTSPSKPLFWKSSLSKEEDRVWRKAVI